MTITGRVPRTALAATAAMAGVALLAVPAPAATGTPPPTTGATPTPAAVAMTRIVVTMARCEGCTVRAARFYSRGSRTVSARYLAAARVSNGVAVLRVPTASTVGMAFEVITRDHAGNGNAMPVVVLRFARTPVGSVATRTTALRSHSGSWCWGGTRAARVTLPLATYRWRVTAVGPDQGPNISIWSTVMRGVLPGTFGPTWRGGMGHQDAPYCHVA